MNQTEPGAAFTLDQCACLYLRNNSTTRAPSQRTSQTNEKVLQHGLIACT